MSTLMAGPTLLGRHAPGGGVPGRRETCARRRYVPVKATPPAAAGRPRPPVIEMADYAEISHIALSPMRRFGIIWGVGFDGKRIDFGALKGRAGRLCARPR